LEPMEKGKTQLLRELVLPGRSYAHSCSEEGTECITLARLARPPLRL